MKTLDSLIFNIKMPSVEPYPGALLVAEPFLRESYFNHAVVCLVDYERGKGVMGVVLNKITRYTLNELVSSIVVDKPIPVFCGGPMSQDHLYFIHTLGDAIPGSRHIVGNLYIGGDFDIVVDMINSGYDIDGSIRFCLGYSGWDAGQLEGEIRKAVWAVTSIPDMGRILTGEEDTYWHSMVRSMGDCYRGWLYHPQDPRMN